MFNPYLDTQFEEFVKSFVDQDFLLVGFLTFFVCEGIFRTGLIKNDGVKVILAIAFGGLLGLLLMPTEVTPAIAKGMLAGAATTAIVAKFKKPSQG